MYKTDRFAKKRREENRKGKKEGREIKEKKENKPIHDGYTSAGINVTYGPATHSAA